MVTDASNSSVLRAALPHLAMPLGPWLGSHSRSAVHCRSESRCDEKMKCDHGLQAYLAAWVAKSLSGCIG